MAPLLCYGRSCRWPWYPRVPPQPEYTFQCYECTATPDCPHSRAFQSTEDMDTATTSQNTSTEDSDRATGRGPKRQARPRAGSPDHTNNEATCNHPTPIQGPNLDTLHGQCPHPLDAPYLLFVEHTQIQFDMYLTPHSTRGQVLQTKGFPDFKSATRKDMVDMVISTTRTIRAITESVGALVVHPEQDHQSPQRPPPAHVHGTRQDYHFHVLLRVGI